MPRRRCRKHKLKKYPGQGGSPPCSLQRKVVLSTLHFWPDNLHDGTGQLTAFVFPLRTLLLIMICRVLNSSTTSTSSSSSPTLMLFLYTVTQFPSTNNNGCFQGSLGVSTQRAMAPRLLFQAVEGVYLRIMRGAWRSWTSATVQIKRQESSKTQEKVGLGESKSALGMSQHCGAYVACLQLFALLNEIVMGLVCFSFKTSLPRLGAFSLKPIVWWPVQ